jgi:hypothetical protein
MRAPEYELCISQIPAGEIRKVDEAYMLPNLYLGQLPAPDELHELYEESLGELTLEIEDPGTLYGDGCYLSLVIPARDPTRKPATMSDWGWQTLTQILIPSQSIGLLINGLQAVQRMRRAQRMSAEE